MDPLDIKVRALVNDAVQGLDLVNEKIDDQSREVYRLAKAQHDLEASAIKLAEAQHTLSKNTDPLKQHDLESAVLDARVALDKQQQEVNDLARSYSGLSEASTQTKISITDFKSALDITRDALGYMKQGFDATIARAIEWGGQMGDIADITGASVEETSKLVAVYKLLGGETNDLREIMKSAADHGIQLTYDNLVDLGKQYKEIQDPIERTKFLFTNFGEKGMNVAEILGRDTRELEKLGREAEKTGLVIDKQLADQAERVGVEMNILQSKVDGAATRLGFLGLQILDSVAIGFREAMQASIGFADSIKMDSPMGTLLRGILLNNAALVEYANAIHVVNKETADAPGYIDAYSRSSAIAASSISTFADEQAEMNKQLQDLNTIIGGSLGKSQEQYYQDQGDLASQARDVKAELDKLKESNGQYYSYVKTNGATAAEVELANQKLAKAYAQLNEETDPLKIAQLNVEVERQQKIVAGASEVVDGYVDNTKKIDELQGTYDEITAKIEENRKAHEEATARIVFGFIMQKAAADGFKNLSITELGEIGQAWGIYDQTTADALAAVDRAVSEHGATAESVLNAVGGAIRGLPTEKTFTYHVVVDNPNNLAFGSEDFGGAGETNASPVTPIVPTPDTENKPAAGGGFAQGGSFTVPGSGAGDRPYLVSLTPGERVDVTPYADASKRGSGGASITVERGAIVINGDGRSAKEIAEETVNRLASRVRALGSAGRQYTSE